MSEIADNLKRIKEKINALCSRIGRNEKEIELVAVTKGVPVEKIEEVISQGIKIIGENRVQEAKEKFPLIGNKVSWHLVGHLQRNKVKTALEIFDLIHSLDSLELAEELEKRCRGASKRIKVLVEVNTSAEATKFGIDILKPFDFFERLITFENLEVCGLMTIAPFTDDRELIRICFTRLKSLKESLDEFFPQLNLKYLSMGMSDDFEIALEEGSNMLRIGRAIFGQRR